MPLLAFYLPQYHPIPENDAWWGPGFTEWVNVAAARPLFPWHYQPHLPGDLGFYDLRLAEVREDQAGLARTHGVDGFCYYHYWFGGRRILHRPVDEVLASGRPDFPFCLCWANENWTRVWDGGDHEVLLRQTYSAEDDIAHIRWLCGAFRDPRYIRVDGKPLFLVYRAGGLPDPKTTTTRWRAQAHKEGVGDLFLCRVESFPEERGDPRPMGFDAAVEFQPDWAELGLSPRGIAGWVGSRLMALRGRGAGVAVREYRAVVEQMVARPRPTYPRFPCVSPGWDNTPRRKRGGLILKDSTPELYEKWLRDVLRRSGAGELVFVNAWNEWGEGNHLEPCRRWGHAFLDATRRAVADYASI